MLDDLTYNSKEFFIWLLPIKYWGDFPTRPCLTLPASWIIADAKVSTLSPNPFSSEKSLNHVFLSRSRINIPGLKIET